MPSITELFCFLTAAREVSIIIISPNFALEKEAVGRKFNQGDKAVSGGGGGKLRFIRGDRALPT